MWTEEPRVSVSLAVKLGEVTVYPEGVRTLPGLPLVCWEIK